MKPKLNQTPADPSTWHKMDRCNTPAYALDPLLPFIRPAWTVWESAAGTGSLSTALAPHVRSVISTELRTEAIGENVEGGRNFFEWRAPAFDAIITNPPYSIKFDWLARCYALGKPFALLVPVETIGAKAAQALMERCGAELLLLNRRVNFEMPNKGWDGSSAQFPVLWLCWQLLPAPIVYGKITQRSSAQLLLFEEAG